MDRSYSVLMSVYEKENPAWLKVSLDSMLCQSLPPQEIVLVQDGPLTKELSEVVDMYRRQYRDILKVVPLSQNQGLGLALRQGILACSNEIIVRMDTDDYSKPERVQLQLQAMEEQKADIVSCTIGEFSSDIEHVQEYKRVPQQSEAIGRYAKRRNPFNHPAVVVRKSKVLAAGNYRDCHWIEDYDLWIRMLQQGCTGYNLSEPLVYMRVNDDSYNRRGGWKYLKSMLSFNWNYYRQGWYSWKDWMVRSGASIIVTLIPNGIRNAIYKHLLRQ